MSDKRDIQFRAWDIKGKHMLNVGALDWHWSHIAVYAEAETLEWRPDMDVDCVLMQLTGLKDRNGKDIYEGDILLDAVGVGEVKWMPEHCAFLVRTTDPHQYHRLESDGQLKISEIVGNVYENPELLGKEVKEAPADV